jgi:hypothetical protein
MMQLRNRKTKLDTFAEPEGISFKRQTIRSTEKPSSEPIPASGPMAPFAPIERTKSDMDIDELRKEYANNPQALQALEEHFKGLKTASETGILESRTENVNFSSHFFRKDIIENFTKSVMAQIPAEKKSSFPLSSYKLYNADDILENISQRGTFKTRYTEKMPQYQRLRKSNMNKLIKYLSSKICQDIGSDYTKLAVERAISLKDKKDIFDIVVISNKNIETLGLTSEEEEEEEQEAGGQYDSDSDDEDYEPESDEESIDSINEIIAYRLSGVVGFIIVELGECKTYPFGYSINLICTNNKAPAGAGSILMGLYLYTILCHPDKIDKTKIKFPDGKGIMNIIEKPIDSDNNEDTMTETSFTTSEPLTPVQQYGILELAAAYINPGGLCMYEKFGFQYTESMYEKKCFADYSNLPMLIDFNNKPGYSELTKQQRQQKVVNITAGIDKGFPKSKICSVRDSYINPAGKLIQTKEQSLLGYLKTLRLLLDHDMSKVTGLKADKTIEDLYYTIKFINEPKSRTPYEDRPEPANPGSVDAYINYLETPQANRTGTMDLSRLVTLIPFKKSRGGTKRRHVRKNRLTKKIKKIMKTKKNLKTIYKSKRHSKHKH